MALGSFEYLNPADVVAQGLAPTRETYLDSYDLRTIDIPHMKAEVIQKYNPTITGFVDLFAGKEQLTSDQCRWTELEKDAVTYDDAILTVGATTTLTRNSSAKVAYRKHEKVFIQTSAGSGVFIVLEVNSPTEVELGTYNAKSIALESAYTVPLTGSYCFSLGIEVGKGSKGADFENGLSLPYRVLSNIPAITRDVYKTLGSQTPQIQWALVNGQPRWYITEINATRSRFLGSVEKKLVDGEEPAAGSDAAALGLQGTQGVFDAVAERGMTFTGIISSQSDLESIIDHWNKVDAPAMQLFLCNQEQEFAFDSLGQSYNSSYGSAGVLDNYIGDWDNAQDGKMLKLGVKGFEHGGYTMLKQGWKYLKENSFRGNDAMSAAEIVTFLNVPLGKTPVAEGIQTLAFNSRTVMKNYMTNMYLRDYDSWTEGGAFIQPRTNGDDDFKVHFLNESLIALFAGEKFMIGRKE